jgi:hypothetical protein
MDKRPLSGERTSTVRAVVTGVWLAVSAVQFLVWSVICLIGWHFANPWWIWTVLVGGVVVGGFWAVTGKSNGPKEISR